MTSKSKTLLIPVVSYLSGATFFLPILLIFNALVILKYNYPLYFLLLTWFCMSGFILLEHVYSNTLKTFPSTEHILWHLRAHNL